MKITIQSKAGPIEIEVSGSRQRPLARVVSPQQFAGAEAMPQHWYHKGRKPGVYLRRRSPKFEAYVENPEANKELKEAIESLPPEKISKRKKVFFADGQSVEKEIWEIPLLVTKRGTVIPEQELIQLLEARGLNEISREDAVSLWEKEREEAYLQAQRQSDARIRGYEKASEGDRLV